MDDDAPPSAAAPDDRLSPGSRLPRRDPSAAAAGAAPSSITERSAGTAIRDSRQARCPASTLAAGIERPRWPVDAKTSPKNTAAFSQHAQVLTAARWVGAWVGANRDVEGILGTLTKVPGAPCRHAQVESSSNALGIRPSRPDSGAREPEKQVPAHLVARETSARAKRKASTHAKPEASASANPPADRR